MPYSHGSYKGHRYLTLAQAKAAKVSSSPNNINLACQGSGVLNLDNRELKSQHQHPTQNCACSIQANATLIFRWTMAEISPSLTQCAIVAAAFKILLFPA